MVLNWRLQFGHLPWTHSLPDNCQAAHSAEETQSHAHVTTQGPLPSGLPALWRPHPLRADPVLGLNIQVQSTPQGRETGTGWITRNTERGCQISQGRWHLQKAGLCETRGEEARVRQKQSLTWYLQKAGLCEPCREQARVSQKQNLTGRA